MCAFRPLHLVRTCWRICLIQALHAHVARRLLTMSEDELDAELARLDEILRDVIG